MQKLKFYVAGAANGDEEEISFPFDDLSPDRCVVRRGQNPRSIRLLHREVQRNQNVLRSHGRYRRISLAIVNYGVEIALIAFRLQLFEKRKIRWPGGIVDKSSSVVETPIIRIQRHVQSILRFRKHNPGIQSCVDSTSIT